MVLKNLFTELQWRNRHRKQTYGHGERGGEDEMYGKSNMKLTSPYVKWVATHKRGVMGREMGGRFINDGIYVYL